MPDPLDDAALDAIAARCEAAAPGVDMLRGLRRAEDAGYLRFEFFNFLTAAIDDVPALVAALRRERERVGELEAALRLASWDCEHVHHATQDRHAWNVPCPVEARIRAALGEKGEGE